MEIDEKGEIREIYEQKQKKIHDEHKQKHNKAKHKTTCNKIYIKGQNTWKQTVRIYEEWRKRKCVGKNNFDKKKTKNTAEILLVSIKKIKQNIDMQIYCGIRIKKIKFKTIIWFFGLMKTKQLSE